MSLARERTRRLRAKTDPRLEKTRILVAFPRLPHKGIRTVAYGLAKSRCYGRHGMCPLAHLAAIREGEPHMHNTQTRIHNKRGVIWLLAIVSALSLSLVLAGVAMAQVPDDDPNKPPEDVPCIPGTPECTPDVPPETPDVPPEVPDVPPEVPDVPPEVPDVPPEVPPECRRRSRTCRRRSRTSRRRHRARQGRQGCQGHRAPLAHPQRHHPAPRVCPAPRVHRALPARDAPGPARGSPEHARGSCYPEHTGGPGCPRGAGHPGHAHDPE